jgi:carbonic anhydrase
VPTWWPNIEENVQTHFNRNTSYPHISDDAFISPFSIVIGNCYIGKFVLAAPTSVCRADEGTPIFIGDLSNIQDGAVLHGLETTNDGKNIDNRRYSTDGNLLLGNDSGFDKGYSVYVGYNTSLAHDSMAHGPAWIGNNTFLGMKSIVFNAKVGNNVAVGISSK